ncbi:TVP38/TMEM64 family protein [Brachybacterium sp. UMB0905]|uniref:TVP38/TMEM64 family protein n=1 Tax=Brachybacterium sp. UMB0905 TaxID=2069310 RepID=UPI001E3DC208|nr:TVP38/TMEM64 family protein [Brachybacterium sp. UMB0905]
MSAVSDPVRPAAGLPRRERAGSVRVSRLGSDGTRAGRPSARDADDVRAETPATAARADESHTARRRDPLAIAARLSPLLGLALSIGLVWWGLDSGVLRSLANLQAFIDSLGAWGPIVFLIVSAAAVVFPIVPGGLLVIAGPVLFGAIEGTVYNYIAVCAGSLLNFLIARHVGLALIERIFPARLVDKYLGWTRSPHFTRAFAIAIVLPVAPDDLLCYLAGTTRMRWGTYVAIILLGKPWALVAYGLGISTVLLQLVPW